MNNLSKRLMVIANMVDSTSKKIVDIGCDHGLLDIYLSNKYEDIKLIASDINKNALNNVINNIKKYKTTKVEARLSNGLEKIDSKEIDTIIISGLGSNTIVKILEDKNKLVNVNTIIIQSNNNLDYLRKEVVKLGFYIIDEELVEDKNIIYTVIKFKKGTKKYTNKEVYLGPILLKKKGKLYNKYITNKINKLNNILNTVPKTKIIYRLKLKRLIMMMKM